LLSEGIHKMRHTYSCALCKHEWQKTEMPDALPGDCPSCDGPSARVSKVKDATISLIDEFTLLAAHTSAKVTLVSGDSEEGQTLLSAFGGLGAILRYSWS